MKDNLSYDFADAIAAYDFADASLGFVSFECLIIALIVGFSKMNAGWGIAAFVIAVALYMIPIVGGVLSIALSLIETLIVFAILFEISTPTITCFLTILSFFILVSIHGHFGVISDDGIFGYSLIISETLIISWAVWFATKSIPLACILFVILIIIMFVPVVRVFELVALSFTTSLVVFTLAHMIIEKIQYCIAAALIVLAYTGYNHAAAYSKINYSEMKRIRNRQKLEEEVFINYEMLKERLYNQYPEIGKQYHYYKVSICKNEKEQEEFELDWKKYLYYLDTTGTFCTFNSFFEDKGLYKSSSYNTEFANEWKQRQFESHQDNASAEQEKETEEKMDESHIIYFAGVQDAEALKKRYHDLLKIYHPDNQNGEVGTMQQIQQEYEYLKTCLGDKS